MTALQFRVGCDMCWDIDVDGGQADLSIPLSLSVEREAVEAPTTETLGQDKVDSRDARHIVPCDDAVRLEDVLHGRSHYLGGDL